MKYICTSFILKISAGKILMHCDRILFARAFEIINRVQVEHDFTHTETFLFHHLHLPSHPPLTLHLVVFAQNITKGLYTNHARI